MSDTQRELTKEERDVARAELWRWNFHERVSQKKIVETIKAATGVAFEQQTVSKSIKKGPGMAFAQRLAETRDPGRSLAAMVRRYREEGSVERLIAEIEASKGRAALEPGDSLGGQAPEADDDLPELFRRAAARRPGRFTDADVRSAVSLTRDRGPGHITSEIAERVLEAISTASFFIPKAEAPVLRVAERTVEYAPRAEFETWPEFAAHFGPLVGMNETEVAEVSRDAAKTGWQGLTGEEAKRYLLERRDAYRAVRGQATNVHQRARVDDAVEDVADGRSEQEKALEQAAKETAERKAKVAKKQQKKKKKRP